MDPLEELISRPSTQNEGAIRVAWKTDFKIVGDTLWVRLYDGSGAELATKLGFRKSDAFRFANAIALAAHTMKDD